jgi:predicted RNA binding protein YcfA (HicA-like mRNA interferase family)
MPRLTPVSRLELIRKLKDLGFEGPEQGKSSHPYMTRGNFTLTIPNEHPYPIDVGLLSRILRQAGISRDEWLLL